MGKLVAALIAVACTSAPFAVAACSAAEAPRVEQVNVVKVAVFTDGRIEVDGATSTADQLASRLDAAKASGASVAYYREGSDQDPAPVAEESMMIVLEAVMSRGLPISMSSKPDFSDIIDAEGQSRPRTSAAGSAQ